MPDIRCSHCGRDNPDFLDVCQFCQSPLKSESMLHIGQKPTKKTTGELEGVLPDWLKTARQQSRDSAEEDAAFAAAQPKVQKEEPPDLLAGLFQSQSSDEEDIPDWLSNINPTAKSKPATPLSSAAPKPETDFFAQFNQGQPGQADRSKPVEEPAQPAQTPADRDELSEWFIHTSEQPAEPLSPDRGTPHSEWGIGDVPAYRAEETPAPKKEEEDLSWLHNLESAAKQTDELRSPKQPDWGSNFGAPSSTSGEEDLSWLNDLGGISVPDQPVTPPAQSSQAQEDLRWLNNLGGTPSPAASDSDEDLSWLNKLSTVSPEPPASQPAKSQDDLSWLNAFSAETPEPSQPAQPAAQENPSWLDQFNAAPTEEPPQAESPKEDLSWLNSFGASREPSAPAPAPSASAEDLDWLNKLGATQAEPSSPASTPPQEDLSWLNAFSAAPESSQPAEPTSQEDLSWLNSLQGEPDTLSSAPFAEPTPDETTNADIPHVSPFMPRKTAPLDETAASTDMPDWLKSATEEPSMPMGTSALDRFREDYKIPTTPEEPFSWKSFTQEAKPAEPSTPPQQQPAFTDSDFFGTSSEGSSIPSEEDVNSLFSMEMPDWLSQAEPTKQEEPSQTIGIHAEGGEALAPVDLPSWVQAMRPVDAVIAEATPSIDDQPAEREGPLAGLKGLIPAVPLGSARRPKAISLKLQASDEQQASAAILEQLLSAETSPRPLFSAPVFASQRALRWVLAGLFLLVLGAVIGLQSQLFAASAALPVEARELTNIVSGLPELANVLVVVDYEPALAGEMEAVSGPLLDQLASLRHPKLSFLSTSPNGSALVDRLLTTANLNALGYSAGQNYFNLGYLAGAESGVLAFLQSPRVAVPSAPVSAFSEYSAVIVLTDNAESSKTWIEQLEMMKQRDASLGLQPLLVASSAQAGPLLQPYALSRQVNGLISGLADASRFEFVNNSRPGLARSYLDAYGVGLMMAVGLIVFGSLWSIVAGMRARRAETAEG